LEERNDDAILEKRRQPGQGSPLMCGVVAIMSYAAHAPRVDEAQLLRIRDRMVKRGPDAAGCWISEDKRVGLGHRRLAIIDLSPRGVQPMAIEETGTRITFNGEIYNYRELRSTLEQFGRVFRTDSDTEVLLHAYEQYGADMVRHLRGMYAFAIWDSRRNGLFLARDPFGIKPLYYYDDGRQIVVASQVKALLASGNVPARTSASGKVSFLLWGFIMEPHTLYQDIWSVPAGSTVWVDAAGVGSPAKFWDAAGIFQEAEGRRAALTAAEARPEAMAERLRGALLDSVRAHMVADVPVGVFLSAGLDSGTLVALASEDGVNDLRTLTMGFDELRGMPDDEVRYAEEVAAAYQTKHQSCWVSAEEFAEDLTELLESMDQPSVDGANVFFVSKVAAAAGLKVAMSGLGGDELFGGYPSFRQIPTIVALVAPFSAVPSFGRGFRTIAAPLLRQFTSPKYASIFEYGTAVGDAYLLRRGLFLPWELPEILDPDEAAAGWRELHLMDSLKLNAGATQDRHCQIAALEMQIYMRNQLLRDSDWAGMAHSLEIRVPFVDAVLLQELAPLLVGKHRVNKSVMAASLRRPLPAAILARPKTGFTVPIRTWLMRDGAFNGEKQERGLRSWAKFVLAQQAPNDQQ
jgi:asparagine synthase (glutamine-hydrolysing)